MPKGDGHASNLLTHFSWLQALSPELRVLRFRVECISVSKKYRILGSFPIRGCFRFTCRSLQLSLVFDKLFCCYEVRHKQNSRFSKLGWIETRVVLWISSDGFDRRISWVWNFRFRDFLGVAKENLAKILSDGLIELKIVIRGLPAYSGRVVVYGIFLFFFFFGGGVIFGPGIFWAFDFCSHSNIHVTLNREYPLKLAVVKALFALLINKIRTTVIKKIEKINWMFWMARKLNCED